MFNLNEETKMISNNTKELINQKIYELASIIEDRLSDNNFFLAKMAAVKPSEVHNVALKTAIMQISNQIKNN